MAEQKRRPLIEYQVAKPFVDATALALGSAAFAVVMDGAAVNWALIGSGCSLFWYWGSANIASKSRRKKGRTIPIYSANEKRDVRIFDQVMPGYIARDTWSETLRHLVFGQPKVANKRPQIDKPPLLSEYVFTSYHNGQPTQLLDSDVRRFLASAWRNRDRGSGLGQRRWVREWRERPQWYKDLGRGWYFAFVGLLRQAQQISRRQLVVTMGHQHYGLKFDPHTTLSILKWAETHK